MYNFLGFVSSFKDKELISLLSDEITYPDMTALWHEDIKEINTNMSKLDDFRLCFFF